MRRFVLAAVAPAALFVLGCSDGDGAEELGANCDPAVRDALVAQQREAASPMYCPATLPGGFEVSATDRESLTLSSGAGNLIVWQGSRDWRWLLNAASESAMFGPLPAKLFRQSEEAAFVVALAPGGSSYMVEGRGVVEADLVAFAAALVPLDAEVLVRALLPNSAFEGKPWIGEVNSYLDRVDPSALHICDVEHIAPQPADQAVSAAYTKPTERRPNEIPVTMQHIVLHFEGNGAEQYLSAIESAVEDCPADRANSPGSETRLLDYPDLGDAVVALRIGSRSSKSLIVREMALVREGDRVSVLQHIESFPLDAQLPDTLILSQAQLAADKLAW